MVYDAFCLLDTKTGIHHMPFFVSHPGQATRMLTDLVGDPNTTVGRHPADFVLIRIGTYDDQTGVLAASQPASFGSASGFITRKPPPLFEELDRQLQTGNGSELRRS